MFASIVAVSASCRLCSAFLKMFEIICVASKTSFWSPSILTWPAAFRILISTLNWWPTSWIWRIWNQGSWEIILFYLALYLKHIDISATHIIYVTDHVPEWRWVGGLNDVVLGSSTQKSNIPTKTKTGWLTWSRMMMCNVYICEYMCMQNTKLPLPMNMVQYNIQWHDKTSITQATKVLSHHWRGQG